MIKQTFETADEICKRIKVDIEKRFGEYSQVLSDDTIRAGQLGALKTIYDILRREYEIVSDERDKKAAEVLELRKYIGEISDTEKAATE